jgi:predicted Zn-dependent protease
MTPSGREELARRALALSRADQTEVFVFGQDSALTRFTHESIHQSVAASDIAMSVRAIVDGRTGVAQTNRLDGDALRDVVAQAHAMAGLAPKDPMQPPLPNGGAAKTPGGAYAQATASASAEHRAAMCGAIFVPAERDGFWSAGYASTTASGVTIANSNGTLASFDGTDAAVNVKMSGSDSTGFGEACANDVTHIDAGAVGETAARKARDTRSPRGVDPGAWSVILEPPATAELLSYLLGHFSAQSFEEGSSFFSEGFDSVRLGENVTIHDDFAHPLSPSMPFDFEGHPTQQLALVEAGRVRDIVTDSYWAHKLDRPNTGHALPAPNSDGPQPRNVVVAPGAKSVDQLISETKRGLLVSRFWYIRTVDQKHAIVTGMTRDGTYLIEDGKLAGGVRNLRFNQSIPEALQHCEFASTLKRSSSYSYSMVVPTMKIDGFNFTSTTEF